MLDVARTCLVALSLTLAAVLTVPLAAQPAGYNELAAAQAAANGQPGARKSPAHTSPVPTDEVSAEAQN
jgi:epsilon-lactone hydrolase